MPAEQLQTQKDLAQEREFGRWQGRVESQLEHLTKTQNDTLALINQMVAKQDALHQWKWTFVGGIAAILGLLNYAIPALLKLWLK